MPYAITGYAGGTLRQVVLQDDGTVTGDGLVTGWLADNPPPATDIGAVTLHIGKLLTEVRTALLPPSDAAPQPDPPAPAPAEGAAPAVAETHAAYTQAELEELTVTDLREMATMAGVAGAARLSKADLIAALLQQGS